MSHRNRLALVLLGFLVTAIFAGEAPTPEELVARLGAEDFDVRQEAAEQLQRLGERARPALVNARHNEIPEIRAAVKRLISALKPARLAVHVVDEDGQPYPGRMLKCSLNGWRGEPVEAMLTTDASGIIRLESHETGVHLLSLEGSENRDPRRCSWQPDFLDLQYGENRTFRIFPRGATIRGRVVSATTGEPVEGAEVMVRREDNLEVADAMACWPKPGGNLYKSDNLAFGSTDAKGEFSVEDVNPASLRVYVRHRDYAPDAGLPFNLTGATAHVIGEPIRLISKETAWGRLRVVVLGDNGKAEKGAKISLRLTQVWVPDGYGVNQAYAAWHPRFERHMPAVRMTDDEGCVESDLLEPGAYRLVVYRGDSAQEESDLTGIDYGQVQVKAGQVVSVAGKPFVKSGRLTCRLSGNLGRDVRVFALQEEDPDVKSLFRHPIFSSSYWEDLLENKKNAEYVGAHVGGGHIEVELGNLLPGRHVVGFSFDELPGQNHRGIVRWVFGVDVKPGETTKLGDIVLPETADPREAGLQKTLSGTIFNEDGEPIVGQVGWSIWGGTYHEASTGAHFKIDLAQAIAPELLVFKSVGYEPFRIDLRKPLPDPANLSVKLVHQKYGNVTVLVRDPHGAPLEGARVTPVWTQGTNEARGVETGPGGTAKLSTLPTGPWKINVTLEGFYQPEPLKAEIEAGKTISLSVTLFPGGRQRGRVVLAPGIRPPQVLVWAGKPSPPDTERVVRQNWRSAGVDEQGRFEFTGQAPGPLLLRAQAPGFLSEEVEVNVGEGVESVLELSKPSCAVLELGSGASGGIVELVRSGTWRPLEYRIEEFSGSQDRYFLRTRIDKDGKAIVPNVAPGRYDVLYSPDHTRDNWGAARQNAMRRIATGVKIGNGQAVSVHNLPLQPGTCAVKFQVDPFDRGSLSFTQGREILFVENADTCVSFQLDYFSYYSLSWLVSGTPPEGFPVVTEMQRFKAMALPAGEYRLYLGRDWSGYRYRTRVQPKAILLQTFSLKEGETLDLGTLNLRPPALTGGAESDPWAALDVSEPEIEVGGGGERPFRP